MKKFKEAPQILKIFLVISLFIVLGHFVCLAFFSKGYLKLQPYVGSNSFIPYLFGMLYFFPNKKEIDFDKIKFSIKGLFILFMFFGVIEICLYHKLVVGISLESVILYRILSVFVIPTLWIILLSKKFERLLA